MKDYYGILGVSRSETPSGIRSAYRDLARRHHPDVAGPESTAVFRDIVEAYETLSDAALRRQHDEALRHAGRVRIRRRRAADETAPLFAHPETMQPSAAALRERWLRNFTARSVPKFERLEPLVCDVSLSAEEARRGGVLPIRLPLLAPCAFCHGAGGSAFFPCLACDARGWLPREHVLELRIPAGVRPGSTLDVSLAPLGVTNLWLHVRVDVRA